MDDLLTNITLEQFVKRFVSSDEHIRVLSFGLVSTYYSWDCNVVYDGEAYAVYRDKISSDIASLRVRGIDASIRGILYIFCD